MVKGPKRKEIKSHVREDVVYRMLDGLNYSMIKRFDENPILFYREFILGEKREDKSSTFMLLGDLCDFLLLECMGDNDEFDQRFDEKFSLFEGGIGSGQSFVLADILFKVTKESIGDSGEVKVSFEERFKDAFFKLKQLKDGEGKDRYYKGKGWEDALLDFNKPTKSGPAAYEYFNLKMANVDKKVVDSFQVEKAKIVVSNVLNDEFTKGEFEHDDDKEVHCHFPIEWDFDLHNGRFIKCKSELDRLCIYHKDKIIQAEDFKTNYDNESWEYMYIKNSYYLQAAFYTMAAKCWAAKQPELKGYKVIPPNFIVGDTSVNNRRPLIYYLGMRDLDAGLNGFYFRGNKYRGIVELIEDIAWADENNIWDASRESCRKNGKLLLNINYDSVL